MEVVQLGHWAAARYQAPSKGSSVAGQLWSLEDLWVRWTASASVQQVGGPWKSVESPPNHSPHCKNTPPHAPHTTANMPVSLNKHLVRSLGSSTDLKYNSEFILAKKQ